MPITSMTAASPVFDYRSEQTNRNEIDRLKDEFAKKLKVEVIKGRFLDAGKAVIAASYSFRIGGFLLEHGAAFYAYSQIAPASVFEQYFYANAIHEFSMSVMNYTICGVSASSLATATFAIISGIIVTKAGVTIYNLFVYKESRVNLTLVATIQNIFWRT